MLSIKILRLTVNYERFSSNVRYEIEPRFFLTIIRDVKIERRFSLKKPFLLPTT